MQMATAIDGHDDEPPGAAAAPPPAGLAGASTTWVARSLVERLSLAGKVAVVTGAGQGIGAATCMALAEMGADVALVDLPSKQAAMEAVAAAATAQFGVRAIVLPADATARPEIDRVVSSALGQLGSVGIAVATVGGNPKDAARGSVLEETPAHIQGTIDMTLLAGWNLLQSVGRVMRDGGRGGAVVMIGSVMAEYSQQDASGYSMCKAALKQLARTAAHELAPHVSLSAC